jgi:hypothetical protein
MADPQLVRRFEWLSDLLAIVSADFRRLVMSNADLATDSGQKSRSILRDFPLPILIARRSARRPP